MGRVITKEELQARATKEFELAAWSKEVGAPRTVRIRRLLLSEFLAMRPDPIPGSDGWAPEERADKIGAYLAALPEAERRTRSLAWEELDVRLVAAACVDPSVSIQEARWFGPDLEALVKEILTFSGLLTEAPPAKTDASAAGA